MAHVQIRGGKNGPTTLEIIIDGVDMTNHIYTEGFGLVRVGDEPYAAVWGVSMILAPDSLDIDLPDAVIQAITRSNDDATTAKDSA